MLPTHTIHFRGNDPDPDYTREHQRSRVLVKDGRWTVPPEERPAGWESMMSGGDEKVINARNATRN